MTLINQNSISGINSITAESNAIAFYDVAGSKLNIDSDITGDVTVATGATISGSTNTITASTNGSERLRITSSGNIGIGTDNPLSTLHLSNNGAEGLEVYIASGSDINVIQHYNRSGSSWVSHRNIALDHRFETYGVEKLRITSTGNVGIGTDNPGQKLVVLDNAPSGTSNFYVNNTGGDAVIYLLNNDQYSAGLGTLTDNGSYIELSGKWNSTNTNANRTFGRIGAFKENNTSADGAGYLSLYSRPDGGGLTERVRITSTGNVGIGSTQPTAKLDVNGDLYVEGNSNLIKVCHLKTDVNASVTEGSGNAFTVDFNLQEYRDTDYFTHSNGIITVLKAGWYKITGNLVYQNADGSVRNTIRAYVLKNGSEITSTATYDYDRGSTYGEFSNNKIDTFLQLAADDTIAIGNYGYNIDGTVTIESAECEFIVTYFR